MKEIECLKVEISVIVPVYNAAKYLNRCVNSLLAQQLQWEFELLFVDDGSNDGSLKILKVWEQRDRRVRVFSQPNRGVSTARNFGLRQANGSYVTFVDSDDWVENNYLAELRNNVDASRPGLVMGGFYRETRDGMIEHTETSYIYYPEEFPKMLNDRQLYRFGYPWGKLFNLSIIREYCLIFAEDVHYGEDLIFMFSYLCHIEYVRFVERCGYHYDMIRQDSLGLKYYAYESELKGYRSLRDVVINFKQQYQVSEEELKPTIGRVVYFALRAIKVMYRPGKSHLKYCERQEHLANDWTYSDRSLIGACASQYHGIDRQVCAGIRKRQHILIEIFLSLFFFLRYSFIGKLYMKYIRK